MEIILSEKMDTPISGADLAHESGLATAEYAVATIAAVGFAGLLITLLRSDGIRSVLENIITTALTSAGS